VIAGRRGLNAEVETARSRTASPAGRVSIRHPGSSTAGQARQAAELSYFSAASLAEPSGECGGPRHAPEATAYRSSTKIARDYSDGGLPCTDRTNQRRGVLSTRHDTRTFDCSMTRGEKLSSELERLTPNADFWRPRWSDPPRSYGRGQRRRWCRSAETQSRGAVQDHETWKHHMMNRNVNC